MLHATVLLEDCTMVATVPHIKNTEDGLPETWATNWIVTLQDNMTGKSHVCTMTHLQFAAVNALAHGIGEDENIPAHVTEYLYSVATQALEGCPRECMPIP